MVRWGSGARYQGWSLCRGGGDNRLEGKARLLLGRCCLHPRQTAPQPLTAAPPAAFVGVTQPLAVAPPVAFVWVAGTILAASTCPPRFGPLSLEGKAGREGTHAHTRSYQQDGVARLGRCHGARSRALSGRQGQRTQSASAHHNLACRPPYCSSLDLGPVGRMAEAGTWACPQRSESYDYNTARRWQGPAGRPVAALQRTQAPPGWGPTGPLTKVRQVW